MAQILRNKSCRRLFHPHESQKSQYSFVYIVKGERVIGYDNAEGRGDHRHHGGKERPYKFQGIEKLWHDFTADLQKYREGKR